MPIDDEFEIGHSALGRGDNSGADGDVSPEVVKPIDDKADCDGVSDVSPELVEPIDDRADCDDVRDGALVKRPSRNRGSWPRRLGRYTLRSVALVIVLLIGMIAVESTLGDSFENQALALSNELRQPDELAFEMVDGVKTFTLELQEGQTVFKDGAATTTWGANEMSYLMPTIRVRNGDEIRINVTNSLDMATTLHWHGMHVPASEDGVHQPILPGETWSPSWTIDQPAATLWYHPHLHGYTGEHVYNGLAGLFIVEDDTSETLDLPKTTGVDDIAVIVQDRSFDDTGNFVTYDSQNSDLYGHTGMHGEEILVTGTHAPFAEVPAGYIRLRILNGSNARRYNFGFSDDRPFHLIATDGGFLETPAELDRILLAPGERAEIVVDMSNRDNVTLMSYPVPTGRIAIQEFIDRVTGSTRDQGQKFNVLQIRAERTGEPHLTLPSELTEMYRFLESESVNTRKFVLGADNTINGARMAVDRIDEVVMLDTIEIWEVTNDTASYHPFHVHDVQFQVLERNGKPPPPAESGWKDTVIVGTNDKLRLIMQFTDYADPNVPYMYHCHILEHEDHGMMGQFVVVDPNSTEPVVDTPLLDWMTSEGHINQHAGHHAPEGD